MAGPDTPAPIQERLPDGRVVARHWLKPPVNVPFHEATPEQVAQAICAAAKPPDPSKRRPPVRKRHG